MHTLSIGLLIEGRMNLFGEGATSYNTKFKGVITKFSTARSGDVFLDVDLIWVENSNAKNNFKTTCWAQDVRPVTYKGFIDEQY
jgi:hypothetical protein